ncbi:MAG: ABC transporter permease [Bacteroidetes bacterium]|nr:ABC transporter permease [Bacteroidota bacterium]
MERFQPFFIWFGESALFLKQFFICLFTQKFEWRQFLQQFDEIGSRSLILVGISGLAIGVVLSMQFNATLARFGAESMLPSMISLSVIREIGPIITALVVAGRVASGIGAELGSMRVTEQIDALDVSAVDSFNFLVVPRIMAGIIALPILTVYCDFIAIIGGYFGILIERTITLQEYISAAIRFLGPDDIFPGVLKTTVFGLIITFVGSFNGYKTTGGTVGVGLSATNAVVLSSLLIIVAEVVLVKISILFF